MVLFHIQAVAALSLFTWTNLLVALVLYWVAVGLGISMGYHRLHTHRGFKTSKAVRVFPGRLRHADARGRADFLGGHAPACTISIPTSDGDPHTPRVSGFWAHMGWIIFGEAHTTTRAMSRYAPDLGETRSTAG